MAAPGSTRVISDSLLGENQIKKPIEQVRQGALEGFGRGERIRLKCL